MRIASVSNNNAYQNQKSFKAKGFVFSEYREKVLSAIPIEHKASFYDSLENIKIDGQHTLLEVVGNPFPNIFRIRAKSPLNNRDKGFAVFNLGGKNVAGDITEACNIANINLMLKTQVNL